MPDCDAVVIGSGHNGLVCALCLAHAGWRVLVLERADDIGGGVRTAEVTLPGYRHDLFATNVGQFAGSPVYRRFREDFDRAGLRFVAGKFPFCSAYDDGSAARMYTDADLTEREMAAHSEADLAGWRRVLALFARSAPHFLPLQSTLLPSAGMVRRIGALIGAARGDSLRLARIVLQSSRGFVDEYFHTPQVKGLFTPWAFHPDYGPDVRGGAMAAFVAAISAQRQGLQFAQGGAGEIVRALRELLERYGGRILCRTAVTRIQVRQGGAVGVETAGGDTIVAARAVIANVTPRSLFGNLVSPEQIPSGFLRRAGRFRYGPATFVVHLALDCKLQWRAGEDLSEFSYVHLHGQADDIAAAYASSLAGLIPARPMLCVSQATPADPSRAPAGGHVVRIHARAFPARIAGDAQGQIQAVDWESARERVADRLVDILARHAPNLKSALRARYAMSPQDLERANSNWIGGDCSSGSHHLDQFYLFRPIPGWSRYATPIRRLYMTGASTWPGSGVHGASGYMLAQRLLTEKI